MFLALAHTSAQESLNKVYAEIGRPVFLDAGTVNSRIGLLLSAGYTRDLTRDFSINAFYSYSRGGAFPADVSTETLRQEFIGRPLEFLLDNLHYEKIETNIVGAGLNFNFVHTRRWLFNATLNGGFVLSSKSRVLRYNSFSWDMIINAQTGEIISTEVTDFTIKDTRTNLRETFLQFGLGLEYVFYKEYFVGFNTMLLMHQAKNYDESSSFIFANQFYPALRLGFHF